jgi:hypothetical protein
LEIKHTKIFDAMDQPFAIVLLLANRVRKEAEISEGVDLVEGFEIAELSDAIIGENEGCEVGGREMKWGGYGGYAIVGKKESVEPFEERKVGEDSNGVVCEVDAVVLVLCNTEILYGWNAVAAEVQLPFLHRVDERRSLRDELRCKLHDGNAAGATSSPAGLRGSYLRARSFPRSPHGSHSPRV